MEYFEDRSREAEVIATLKKRRAIYTIACACLIIIGGLCGAIPQFGPIICGIFIVLWGIAAGLGMLCINTMRYTISHGRTQGGGLWWLLLLIFGIIVVPILTVVIVRNIRPLASLALGVTFG